MPSHEELLNRLSTDSARKLLSRIYGEDMTLVGEQVLRYERLIAQHEKRFGPKAKDIRLFSAPGRVEVGGNHTDHNHGRVLAAAINLDAIAVASPSADAGITIFSEGYETPFIVDSSDLDRKDSEKGTSFALMRGICRAFRERGYDAGGFNACITSDVTVGSGLSSSAAFEVLVATILNAFYNGSAIPPKEVALAGQYAENHYFGKPSGLMDQMTSAVGGLVTIDFGKPTDPRVRKVDFSFDSCGYDVVVVNTGGSHADLTGHYTSVAEEMRQAARALGAEALREVSPERLIASVKELRTKVGDRAVLRALHFFADNERVIRQVEALEENDFQRFLSLVNESGRSSWMLCQNVYAPERPAEQPVSVALALTDEILAGRGACRVHGGGFAGTILAFVPHDLTAKYTTKMNEVFGPNAAKALRVRPCGAGEIFASK